MGHDGTFPLPGDKVRGRTVVASCPFDPFCLVLVLNSGPPYFSVAQIEHLGDQWVVITERPHMNIVPAVRDYEDSGGDY